ncbi:hypothetical protein niasHT_026931 [Heterodera trifolii]|uniref:SHSP domain-containing protein n=1 Tax=Heterodera trifolii TaxID=157864 RepID=A0ABD2KRD2_9BILA
MLTPFSYDPFYRRSLWPMTTTVGNVLSPFRQLERELDHFFEGMQPMLRDHVAQLNVSDKGDLTYKVDVSGFRPEEINVEVLGNEIIVNGEHREQNDSESVHRQFSRRVLIPEGIQKESIKCELDGGRLFICGMKTAGEGGRTIPIEMKKKAAVEQQQEEEEKKQ